MAVKKQVKKDKILLRPSSATYWKNCHGFIHTPANRNPLDRKQSSQVGTATHNLVDLTLREMVGKSQKRWEAQAEKPTLAAFDLSRFSEEDVTDILHYATYTVRYVAREMTHFLSQYPVSRVDLRVEEPLTYKGKWYTLQGTADITIATPDSLHVWDMKTGMLEQEAEDHDQLEAYAHLKSYQYAKEFEKDFQEVDTRILQPSLGITNTSPNGVQVSKDYFYNLETHVQGKEFKSGPHCLYCPHADVCREFRRRMDEYLRVDIDGLTVDRVEEWSTLLEMAKPIEKLIDRVKENSKAWLADGKEIPGWEVYHKGIQRQWVPDASISELAKVLKVPKKQLTKEGLKTPKQVELMLNDKQAEKLREFFVQPTTPVLRKIKNKN